MSEEIILSEAMERLIEDYNKSHEAFAKLGLLVKQQKRQQHRKSYLSPYAKFDRYHKKKRK